MAGIELAPAEIQALQDLTILVFAPLVSGAIAHLEGRLQGSPWAADPAALLRHREAVP